MLHFFYLNPLALVNQSLLQLILEWSLMKGERSITNLKCVHNLQYDDTQKMPES